jgi:ribosome-associated protein
MIDICPGVTVSEHELQFSFDRCPGAGGQNSNKVNTRVTLHFNVSGSTSLSRAQKSQLCESLATRINQDGILRIHSSKERTQLANRRAAVNRFIELMSTTFGTSCPQTVEASKNNRRSNGRRTHS